MLRPKFEPANPEILIVAFAGAGVFAWFVNTQVPDTITNIYLFFFLLSSAVFPLAYFLLNNVRRSTLITLALMLFLLSRMLQLREWYYPLLLLILFVSVEVYLNRSVRKY